MKRTDLEKSIGNKISNRIRSKSDSGPFNNDTVKPVDKREQRKIDQAQGLVPFAVKIGIDLVEIIQNKAASDNKTVSEVTAELIRKGLENSK